MQESKQNLFSLIVNFAVGFFFLSVLSFKGGHNVSPVLLTLLGLGYGVYAIIKKFQWNLNKLDKLLISSYIFYFAVFVLSLFVNSGRIRELDNPSRVLLLVPVLLMLLRLPLKQQMFLYAIPLGSFFAGLVALYDRFIANSPMAYTSRIFHIQGGDIAMSLGMFSLVVSLYFAQKMSRFQSAICILASLFGILGSVLSTARGGWVGVPVVLAVMLWIYRHCLSKKFIFGIVGLLVIAVVAVTQMPNSRVMERINAAKYDISAYFTQHNGSTSVGARFDMWKSAVLMAQEKPILGWGTDGVKIKRQQQAEAHIISHEAGQFGHAHNQYLDDLSKRGVIGLLALLSVFGIPFWAFAKKLKNATDEVRLYATLGVVHILSVMSYCLSQGFFSHNSGNILYFFLTVVFYAMLKQQSENAPKYLN